MKKPAFDLIRFALLAGRRLALVAVAAALLLPPPPALAAQITTHLRTRTLNVSYTSPPAGWTGREVVSLPATFFGPAAVSDDGARAYGFATDSATGAHSIGALDLRTGVLSRLLDLPATSSGVLSMAVDGHWLAWVEGDSVFFPQAWTIHALSLATGEEL
ncbi:MAG: hypothetical protein J2P45_19330, partial [Candidatus Dormibacteraeota bacterium]|nr:hypothetical protein [Candidatus Dormibacteraeota bacterium]